MPRVFAPLRRLLIQELNQLRVQFRRPVPVVVAPVDIDIDRRDPLLANGRAGASACDAQLPSLRSADCKVHCGGQPLYCAVQHRLDPLALSALGLNNPTRDGELQRATRHVHVHTDSLALLILAQPVAPFPVAVDFERPFGGEEAVSAALVPQIRLDVDVWRRDPHQTLVAAVDVELHDVHPLGGNRHREQRARHPRKLHPRPCRVKRRTRAAPRRVKQRLDGPRCWRDVARAPGSGGRGGDGRRAGLRVGARLDLGGEPRGKRRVGSQRIDDLEAADVTVEPFGNIEAGSKGVGGLELAHALDEHLLGDFAERFALRAWRLDAAPLGEVRSYA
mmetsp:Transcript_59691/g.140571  ORF Transcript_59691/g.140571 Transcript_59691/m.140571 type:complete len:334 (-) Transcript_59691:305-1306(-)